MHLAILGTDQPSVGATENILTAAVYAKGTTVIDNAAREPEIADLCQFLVSMGADIEQIGTSTLVVHGVEHGSLRAADHDVVPDRIQAATYIAATAVSGGEVVLRGARADHMDMLLRRLRDMGVAVTDVGDGLAVWADGPLHSIDVSTLPYPGIATDYKPLIVTMLSVADGVGIVTENLYPGRFRYVEELQRLGADIRADGHHAQRGRSGHDREGTGNHQRGHVERVAERRDRGAEANSCHHAEQRHHGPERNAPVRTPAPQPGKGQHERGQTDAESCGKQLFF